MVFYWFKAGLRLIRLCYSDWARVTSSHKNTFQNSGDHTDTYLKTTYKLYYMYISYQVRGRAEVTEGLRFGLGFEAIAL